MRRFAFAIFLSAAGGILALPLAAQAQRIKSPAVMSQAALNQALVRQMMVRQMASPAIVSGGPGPQRWHLPGRPPPGMAVPYIVSGGPGPQRWHLPGRPPPGIAVPYSAMASGNGGTDKLYAGYMSQFDATFSPYASFKLRASASLSQK